MALLPRDLPKAALTAFDALSTSEKEEIVTRLRHPDQGPLAKAQALRLMLRRSERESARELLMTILTGESTAQAGAFLQVLLWSWRQLGLPPQAGTMSAAERLVFAWTHAGSLFPMAHAVSPPEAVKTFFTRHNPAAPAEFFAVAAGEDDIASVGNVKAKPLVITAVANALLAETTDAETLAPEAQVAADAWCFQHAEALRWPQLPWLHDPAVFPNESASFFAVPRDVLLAPLLGSEAAKEFSGARLFREIDALLTTLEQDPQSSSAWILLNALLGAQNCPLLLRGRVRGLLERTEVTTLDLNDLARQSATLVFASQACRIGGRELVVRAQAQIAGFAKWCRDQPGNADETRLRKNLLVRAAQSLSRHETIVGDPAGVFAETTLAVLNAWPQVIELLVDACDVLMSLPSEQLVQTSQLLLRIRRDAPRCDQSIFDQPLHDEVLSDE